LLTDQGCAYRSKLEQALARSHVAPRAVMEFTSVEAIKECAALGMGVACLPKIVVDRELSSGKLIVLPWDGFELTMNTLVVWHRDKWLSPAMDAFLSLIRMHLRGGLPGQLRRASQAIAVLPDKSRGSVFGFGKKQGSCRATITTRLSAPAAHRRAHSATKPDAAPH
jgi:LysR substrate binding domain